MRALAVLLLALLLAGCGTSSTPSSTPPHTFSTTTAPTSTSTTTTTGTAAPSKVAVLEIDGWVNGTGPWTPTTLACDPAAFAQVDLAGKKLHLKEDADPENAARLFVFDRSQSVDNATEGGPGCRANVLVGYAAGVQNYTWVMQTAGGWRAGDRTFRLEPGTSTLSVDRQVLPVGKPRAVKLDWNWTRYDGATYHYQGTLWLTYHGEWPRSAVLRDFAFHGFGVARDEAYWSPQAPVT